MWNVFWILVLTGPVLSPVSLTLTPSSTETAQTGNFDSCFSIIQIPRISFIHGSHPAQCWMLWDQPAEPSCGNRRYFRKGLLLCVVPMTSHWPEAAWRKYCGKQTKKKTCWNKDHQQRTTCWSDSEPLNFSLLKQGFNSRVQCLQMSLNHKGVCVCVCEERKRGVAAGPIALTQPSRPREQGSLSSTTAKVVTKITAHSKWVKSAETKMNFKP